ncbi:MAG: alkaline shock response membrane anchor protein AmaP [Actinomycetota bacterium]|nr:alkaline shock response membrane anchor protein AmaP [Actinomycetota bacterium]
MNIFNKVVVVILLLAIAFLSLLSIVNEFIGYFEWSDIALKLVNPNMGVNPFISSLVLLFIFALSIFLLLMEFYRRRSKIATVYKVKDGNAMITLESVAQQIKSSAKTLEGVEDLRVRITPRSKGIIIDMMVDLNQNANIPEKMQQIITEARDIANNKLGIRILKTNLTIVNLKEGSSQVQPKEEEEEKPEERDLQQQDQQPPMQ